MKAFFFFSLASYFIKCFLLIDFTERRGKREGNIDLLFHLFMHSPVASCMCSDWGSNPQPWFIGTTSQLSHPAWAESFLLLNQNLLPYDFYLNQHKRIPRFPSWKPKFRICTAPLGADPDRTPRACKELEGGAPHGPRHNWWLKGAPGTDRQRVPKTWAEGWATMNTTAQSWPTSGQNHRKGEKRSPAPLSLWHTGRTAELGLQV